ncbi:hypothetical protein ACXX82_00245 [Glaciimonas sp. GNP009]
MHAFILIVATYLGGSSWGPQISMQQFSNAAACENGKVAVMAMVEDLNKTNLLGGQAHFRDIASARCVPSSK